MSTKATDDITPSTSRAAAEVDDQLTPPYKEAAVAGLLVFALYVTTLSRSTAFWDTSEYIATGQILGIPHPPGNPLFVVLARAWSVIVGALGFPVAMRINLFSAFMSATAHALWFLVVHHILRYFSTDKVFRLVGASAAVLVSATAFTVWNQSNVNEKVYTVSLMTIALLTWLAVRWQENLGKGKDDNLLVLMAFVLALSVGNHLMAFLAAPAIGIFVLLVHPRSLLNWKLYVGGVIAAILGLSIHLFLPIRAGLEPVINQAAPVCPDLGSALGAVITYGRAGCEALAEAIARGQYVEEGQPGPGTIARQSPFFTAQLVMYLQYFDWQWARSLGGENTVFAGVRLPFTMLFTGLGVWGAIEHWKRDRVSFAYFATLFATLSFALVFYLNFRYGFSLSDPANDRAVHEVRERDYFYIVSFSVWGLWAGMGVATLWQEAAQELRTTLRRVSPILLLAVMPLALNWSWASRAKDYSARDWAYNLLMSVEPYSVLFTNGDNDTFPLWYLQEVEGIRRDVTVIVTSYLNTDWYVRQLKELTSPCEPGEDPASDWTRIQCQRPYTAENTAAAYVNDPSEAPGKVALVVDRPIQPPSRSIFSLTDEQITQVASQWVPIERDMQLTLGNVTAAFRAGDVLLSWQQFALNLINDSIGERPIYFASSGNAAESLGVEPYLVREGLAFRLNNGMPEEDPGRGLVRLAETPYSPVTGDWLAEPRTRQLLDEVFIHRTGLPDEWDHWPDRSTLGIPSYYAWSYIALAQAALQSSDQELLERYQARAEAWSVIAD